MTRQNRRSPSSIYRRRRGWNAYQVLFLVMFWIVFAGGPALAFETQIREEARYIAGKIAERGKTAVAVVDFTDLDGAVTHLGRFMAEELSVALAGASRSFRVVDRSHIRSLLQEHKLAASGLIDEKTARELGRIAGVDTLITATLTPLGDTIRLSIKVLDSENAQVLASSSCGIPKTQAVDLLLQRGVAGPSGGGGPAIAPNSARIADRGQLRFTLQGCARSSDLVTCHFLLTNRGSDANIDLLLRDTRLFDSHGNEVYSSLVSLGSTRHAFRSLRLSAVLVRDVPMRGSAEFEGLPPETRRLTLVEFGFDDFTIQFKDVPIS